MKAKRILVVEDDQAAIEFLNLYFSDILPSLSLVHDDKAAIAFLKQSRPDYVFVNARHLTNYLVKKIRAIFETFPALKVFVLGRCKNVHDFVSAEIALPLELTSFQDAIVKNARIMDIVRVVIVDDEKEVCESIKDFLELRRDPGFKVDYALNGIEGFKTIQKLKPDVAVLDLKMPVKGGADLCKELLKKELCRQIIILTAAVSFEELRDLESDHSILILEKGSQKSYFYDLLVTLQKFAVFA